MNVSSIVIRTAPEHQGAVLEKLSGIEGCEVRLHDGQGRIIVTIEAENGSNEMKAVRAIQGLPHVLSAELAYTYSDEELDGAVKAPAGPVPHRLRD